MSRLEGISYKQIAKKGGGILSTVKQTRLASDHKLLNLCLKRLNDFLSYGVTTTEVKSGYGLSVSEELRHLRLLNSLKQNTSQELIVTCLALHALPPEAHSKSQFIESMSNHLLPKVKEENLATFVDMFIEEGYFSEKDCIPFLSKAHELGLTPRIHADEFSNSNGARIAAKWNAASADHLQHATRENLDSMAKTQTVATILPGTSLYTNIPFTKANKILSAGCPIAIASDHNPGSCQLSNLPLITSLAALHCGLSGAQAIAGITYVAAYSLGLEKTKGAIHPNFDADCVLFPYSNIEQWLASFGSNKVTKTWIRGKEANIKQT